jgi:hypothetical protein
VGSRGGAGWGRGGGGEGQLSLLGPDVARRERLAKALDGLTKRFGEESIRPASVLPRWRRRPPPD